MLNSYETSQDAAEQALSIVMHEKAMSLSDREWRHRVRGFGYALVDTAQGLIVASLRHNQELCRLS
ncbi:hypothetical protein [Thalassovita taeanensis]|uniref:Uncharacterized protein n=1 Tax=Thalassovita taeanensis TaxID=657014 RepID=A0A1H9DU62_9RHOB|nr:hypothetical protein [Thalassovita taeanensis]SEQ16931.1 hypothetical protein SAMN04488092_104281 [Thalassovita taeanensis]